MDKKSDLKQLLEYYISHPIKFPWHWYCDTPKYGPVHLYLCSIIQPFCRGCNKDFLSGKPSLSELCGYVDSMEEFNYDPLILDVAKYCTNLYDKTSRNSVEMEVFSFVVRCESILKDLQNKCRKELGMPRYGV